MAVATSAGAVLSVAAPGVLSPDPTWTAVGEIVNLGEFGRVYTLITFDTLGTRGTRKYKGTYNDGALNLQLGRALSDAGQVLLKAAVDSDFDYLFQVMLNDPTVSASPLTATEFEFEGKVMSFTCNVGGPNQVIGANVVIEIKSGSLLEDPQGTAGTI